MVSPALLLCYQKHSKQPLAAIPGRSNSLIDMVLRWPSSYLDVRSPAFAGPARPESARRCRRDYTDGYHGFWPKNIYNINEHFGGKEQLRAMLDAVHKAGMLAMLDIVPNHMGYPEGDDYSQLVPFNESRWVRCPLALASAAVMVCDTARGAARSGPYRTLIISSRSERRCGMQRSVSPHGLPSLSCAELPVHLATCPQVLPRLRGLRHVLLHCIRL
jgi:hypothetical protein